jgi:hypothetical protein
MDDLGKLTFWRLAIFTNVEWTILQTIILNNMHVPVSHLLQTDPAME